MKTVISFFQLIGAVLLTIGLIVAYNTYDIFFTVGYNPDIGAGFLFWFVAVPGVIVGILLLLVCQLLLWRRPPHNEKAQ